MPTASAPALRPARGAQRSGPVQQSRSGRADIGIQPPARPGGEGTRPETATSRVDGFVARTAIGATKTDTPILETPRSVSVITADEIEARGDQTTQEAVGYTAGVSSTFQERSSLTRQYPHIRGFLAYQYLDGLKLHDSNWGTEVYGLERIEVIKGPSSLLFGQGSPGGLFNYISKRPTETPFNEVFIQTGNRNRIQAGFDFGGPAGNDGTFFYRLTGLGRLADGQVEFTKDQRAYIAPAFTWKPDGATSFTVLASYQYDPNLSLAQTLPADGTINPTALGRIRRDMFLGDPAFQNSSKTTVRIGYEFEHAFNDSIKLRHNLRYSYYDIHAQDIQATGRPLVGGRNLQRQAFLADYSINMLQSDSSLEVKFDTGPISHKVLVGLDYAYIPNYQGAGTMPATSLDVFAPSYGAPATGVPRLAQKRNQDQIQTGIYVQDQMKIGNLSVVVGARQDWLSLINHNRARMGQTDQFAGLKTRQRNDALSPSIGAIYNFESGFAPYVSYSESFFPLTGTDFHGNVFKPITAQQLEGGIKYAPPGYRILLTAAVFDITQQNVRTSDPVNRGYAIQTGEARSQGYELEAKATFARDFDLTLAYTNLDIINTKSTTNNLRKAPPGVPKEMFSGWINYRIPAGPLAGLSIGGGIRHVGSTFGDVTNSFKVPSYTLYDAAIRYDLSKAYAALSGWDVSVTARNIADERYVSYCDSSSTCLYGESRTVLGTLRVRW
ncbi:iron complex outermembrane receptor protein [Enterovirga rhinocerotis]|uniref:Iron complex outermembrane receptor protein n=1 Tax=Enterovirga rhinocerotis TaxID=1339210 RepID=A0A4R7BLT3_9HYPH|nr:iron complex outermembrane receptor protein [Enterovirga rhinocerotis]